MPFAKHFYIHWKNDQPTDAITQPLCTYNMLMFIYRESDKIQSMIYDFMI